METKICCECNKPKYIDQFGTGGHRSEFRRNKCRECVRKWNALPKDEREHIKEEKKETLYTRIEKICPTCKELKPRDGFYKKSSAPDKMSAHCRTCDDIRTRKHREALTIEHMAAGKPTPIEQPCKLCKQVLHISHFTRSSKLKSGFSSHCRACESTKWNKYASSNENRIKILLQRIRSKCNKENIPFDLDVTDIVIPDVCPVFGIPLRFGGTRGYYSTATEGSPSVDRIDSTGGYVKGNIVIVSWRANRIKGNATAEELRLLADFYNKDA